MRSRCPRQGALPPKQAQKLDGGGSITLREHSRKLVETSLAEHGRNISQLAR
ncbi:MAG: hypothetical protein LBV05_12225 [Comamonas sp.]|uniref:hypothetical protein n=1 Tax=Comamonas sp. TaxID=34028 RepID=UPI00283BDDAB|nr:hypothetical protein [Comamonas sp.]MDR3066260.1 hypothetical protein [Comamonas sp.]